MKRSLVAPSKEVAFASADPDDPRIGNIVQPWPKSLSATTTTCLLIGVPQHIGVERNKGRPGAENAPREIRRALNKLSASLVIDEVRAGKLMLIDGGDVNVDGRTLEQIHDSLHDVIVDAINASVIPIVLGGGHDTAWPTMRALMTLQKPFRVVNIDAHADVRPLHEGNRAHSGSPFRQLLDAENSTLVEGGFAEFGLQHVSVSAEHVRYVRNRGMKAMMLDDIRERGVMSTWRTILDHHSDTPLYVSLDMDAFASAYAPGVSAPAADGFAPADIIPCIRHAARQSELVAFDVVEVNPLFDVDSRTSKLAATMVVSFLAGIADRSKQNG